MNPEKNYVKENCVLDLKNHMGSSTIIQTAVRTRKQQNSDLGDSTSDFNNLNFNCVKIQKEVSNFFFMRNFSLILFYR